jgi:hypothetical protein
MPTLRAQLAAWSETLSDLARSAEDRYGDAQRLLIAGRFVGAVYLLGLSAEMWLKLASYRLYGARAADPVGGYARQVQNFMAANAQGVNRGSGHSLQYWTEFILRFSAISGRLLSKEQSGRLRHHLLHRLFEDWDINLRYRPAPVPPELARRVFADAAWLRANWERLGR